MDKNVQIAAYYFPNYHQDPRNALIHGPGWNEWVLMQEAKPRYSGHQQPKVPMWGYEDESDPAVMRRKITAAADHGLHAFIFDWYFYEDGMFLERPLENAFMKIEDGSNLKFAIMWANHDWTDAHPRTAGIKPPVLYPGALSDEAFDRMCDYVIKHYFSHPAYWKIDGCPYFSIYDLHQLGNLERLELFREKTKAAGFPDLHLNLVFWGIPILPGESGPIAVEEIIRQGYFSSITSYVWIHHCILDEFPVTPYAKVRRKYFEFYYDLAGRCPIPFYPNVTMSWDSSPRANQQTEYTSAYTPIVPGTPAEFTEALHMAAKANTNIMIINAWNEWTEGSYLEPDQINGMAYLEAIRDFRKSLP